MPTGESIKQNYAEWQIRGEVDLSSAGAVSAYRGDGIVAAKASTGTYTVTVKGAQALKLYKILKRFADVQPILAATTLGTALYARVSNVATSDDDVVITILTSATKGGAAADNTTTAETVAFEVVVQTRNMSNPLS